MKQSPEIEFLLSEIARQFGRPVTVSSDFEQLSLDVEERTGERLSDSTLKRLWGYVNLNPKPRASTLDILARYTGRPNFRNLCLELQETSDFFSAEVVRSTDLEEDAVVILGWMPDRRVELRYLGDSWFEVRDAGTSKLRNGDRFETTDFMLGHPLYLAGVERAGTQLPAYVAGRSRGLTLLETY